MTLAKTFNSLKESIFKHYADSPSKFLTDTAAIGWALASFANFCGAVFDKKTDSKEKKYIIPQEIANGVTNVGLFYVLTTNLIKLTGNMVDKGVIKFKDVAKDSDQFIKCKRGANVVASLIGAVVASNIITPVVRNTYASYMQKRYLKAIAESRTVGYSLPMFKNKPMTMNSFLAFTNNRSNLKV